jgi:N-acetylmuramoyl-L-alanine amidase
MKKRSNCLYFSVLYSIVIILFVLISVAAGNAVTTIAENAPVENRKCIIIDPGHGGEDGGATSCTGVLESKYNLDISLRLNDLLQMLGYNTKMIRTTDISIYTQGNTIAQKKVSDLKQRVHIVNNTEDAYLISIHQNYFSDGRYSGAQVFYASTEQSKELALLLQRQFPLYLQKENKRTIKKASGVYLMEHIDCPGVLIECGFLSNPTEAANLGDPVYQKKLCCVIATGVSNFLDRENVS